jgi:hypothetical protein
MPWQVQKWNLRSLVARFTPRLGRNSWVVFKLANYLFACEDRFLLLC